MPSRRRIAKPLPVGPYDESQLWQLPYGSEMDALSMGLSRISAYNDAVSRANKQTLINATTLGLNNAAYAILDNDHLLSPITMDDMTKIAGGPFQGVQPRTQPIEERFRRSSRDFPRDGSLHPYGVPARYVPLPGERRLYHIANARTKI